MEITREYDSAKVILNKSIPHPERPGDELLKEGWSMNISTLLRADNAPGDAGEPCFITLSEPVPEGYVLLIGAKGQAKFADIRPSHEGGFVCFLSDGEHIAMAEAPPVMPLSRMDGIETPAGGLS